jgi:hypothetical protein
MGLTFPLWASVVVETGVCSSNLYEPVVSMSALPLIHLHRSQWVMTARLSQCHFWLDDSLGAGRVSSSPWRIGVQGTEMVEHNLSLLGEHTCMKKTYTQEIISMHLQTTVHLAQVVLPACGTVSAFCSTYQRRHPHWPLTHAKLHNSWLWPQLFFVTLWDSNGPQQ